jgi:uncharacterized membrane protein YraQ (UPF0718 family)
MAGQSSSQAASPFQWWKPALFFLVVIVGLWFVKWQPYYGKAFTAAETHSIGKSILAQADANPLKAAWDYAMVYFLAVWKAAVLGVLLGSLIQVLIPRDWLLRTLGQSRFQGTLLGTIFSLPGMMCTCCAAPVAAGMRKQQVSMGGALAFWMGNPLLNPATLVFMGFVLGWQFALVRLVAGLATVLIVATLVQKWVKEAATQPVAVPDAPSEAARAASLAAGCGRCGRCSGTRSRFISSRYWCWERRASGCSRTPMAWWIIRCSGSSRWRSPAACL